jgi:Fe-S cluster assembly protein SufD
MTALALKPVANVDAFAADFAAHSSGLPGAGLAWLDAKRRTAMTAFAKTGVPNRRVEAWKYTDLSSALDEDLQPATRYAGPIADDGPFAAISATRITFANGVLHRVDRFPPDGMEIADLSALDAGTPDWIKNALGTNASGADQPLGAVSLGLMRSGVAVRVKEGNRTLKLEFVNPARGYDWVGHSRVLIVVEEGAALRLLESHAGDGPDRMLANIGMEFVLRPSAKLEHIRLQTETPAALHVASVGGTLARDAEYRAVYAALGARLSRADVRLTLSEPGAHATLHNVAVLNAGIADTTTVMDHASPHTVSRQLFKSVMGGAGRAVNQGRVTVREGAVKSDSHQLFKALLLGPRAEADAKPELEIFADDVVCGHGTAIGALDADALFYLRARGIPEVEAKGLLIRAFLEDAVQGFGDDDIHDALWRALDRALASLDKAEP